MSDELATGTLTCGGELILKDREESARRGDAIGAFLHELRGRIEESPDRGLLPFLVYDDFRARAFHHFIQHRKGHVAACPVSPGTRGHLVSSMRMPTRAP
jgi:hypothetical protein